MKHGQYAALRALLRFNSDLLDHKALMSLSALCGSSSSDMDMSGFYITRCIEKGFLIKLDPIFSERPFGFSIDFSKLFTLNYSASENPPEPSLCYIQVDGWLLSLPISGISLSDIVEYVYSSIRIIVKDPFILHHMDGNGEMGPECWPGQSGSRFVLRSLKGTRSRGSLSSKSRRRCLSFEYPRFLQLTVAPTPAISPRIRLNLRETSEVHNYRSGVFRCHSVDKVKASQRSDITNRVLSIYFGSNSPDDLLSNNSRWVSASEENESRTLPKSEIFVFYPPIDVVTKPVPAPHQLASSSPIEMNPRTETLLTVIQDLISRHVVNNQVNDTILNRAIQQISNPFDVFANSLLGIHREREELRRRYGPINGYLISRSTAIPELTRLLSEHAVDEFMSLADSQGYKDRPFLTQLIKGQWNRLAPKDFRLSAGMLGPTLLLGPGTVPLPEHGRGNIARARLMKEFTEKYLNNLEWTIKVKFVPLLQPICFGPGCDIRELSTEDCLVGYRKSNGLIITKWSGLITNFPNHISVPRSSTIADIISAFKLSINLKHDEFPIDSFVFKSDDPTKRLLEDLSWCSTDQIEVSLLEDGTFRLSRSSSTSLLDPHESSPTIVYKPKTGEKMLWESINDAWNSDEVRNTLTQWSSRGDHHDSESPTDLSPTSRRRRLMEKVASTKLMSENIREEMNELGVDMNTEYSRWWINDTETKTPEEIVTPSRKKNPKLPPPSIFIPTEPVLSPPPQTDSPKSPVTPVSPITRSRKVSIVGGSRSKSPRVLRSTRDTRQFEFHPFDPNIILTGSRSGVVSLVDADRDFVLSQTRVDTSPILGLSWLRSHMNLALYGASSSGLVGMLKADPTNDISYQQIGRFQNLSSVTMNCTDDYFIVSGFSRDISLYDLVSGKRISELKDVHTNFINIVRFSHFSPHLFATSSFDSTCKLWDLRDPKTSIASYTTPTLNVMCCFSPADDNLLVSGLDANVVQLSVKKGLVSNLSQESLMASIPARNSASNYRRAVYLANGENFITSGTDENYMRVIDSRTGKSKGLCKFDGLLQAFQDRLLSGSNRYTLLKDEDVPASNNINNPVVTTEPAVVTSTAIVAKPDEYVQSLRGHPIFSSEVGVLLYPFDRSKSSYVCTAHIPC